MSQNMLDISHLGYDKKLLILHVLIRVYSPLFTLYILLQISHPYCLSHDALSPELCRKAVQYE